MKTSDPLTDPKDESNVHKRNDELRKEDERDPHLHKAQTSAHKVAVVPPTTQPNGTPFGKVPE